MKKAKSPVKSLKANKQAHTSDSPYGSGDYYGTGVKNPVGRMRETYMDACCPNSKDLGKPPKSLA